MPVYFSGNASSADTITLDATVEEVAAILRDGGLERTAPNTFAVAQTRGSRSLFSGGMTLTVEAGSGSSLAVEVALERHTPAVRRWRGASQTRATVTASVSTPREVRFLELQGLNLLARALQLRVSGALEASVRDRDLRPVGR